MLRRNAIAACKRFGLWFRGGYAGLGQSRCHSASEKPMLLPTEIIPVLAQSAPAFTASTYQKALALVVGTIRAKGQRTIMIAGDIHRT